MTLPLVSPGEMRAGQVIVLCGFALWLGIGYVPGLARHANMLRALLLAAYLIGAISFVAYVFIRPHLEPLT